MKFKGRCACNESETNIAASCVAAKVKPVLSAGVGVRNGALAGPFFVPPL